MTEQEEISHKIEVCFHLQIEFLKTTAQALGLRNGYHYPEQLGVDRWVAMIGARTVDLAYRGPLCIVGCGTVMTVDVVDQGDHAAHHWGGLIVPGLSTLHDVLLEVAPQIQAAVLRYPLGAKRTPASGSARKCFLGTCTQDAISSGIDRMAVAYLDRVMHDLECDLGAPVRVYLTGGNAARLRPLLFYPGIEIEPYLVFRGMQALLGDDTAFIDGSRLQ
jgi:type III pantothenate kinase